MHRKQFQSSLIFFQEIAKQASDHHQSLQKIMSSQSGELGVLQQQFDEALKKAVEAGKAETQVSKRRFTVLSDRTQ